MQNTTVKKGLHLRSMVPLVGLLFVLVLFVALTRGSILHFSNLEVITNQAFGVMLVGAGRGVCPRLWRY